MLIILTILTPFIFAIISLLLRGYRTAQRSIAVLATLSTLIVSVLLIITTINFIFSACIIYIVDFELSLEIVASITIIQSLVQVCSIYAYTRYNSQPA